MFQRSVLVFATMCLGIHAQVTINGVDYETSPDWQLSDYGSEYNRVTLPDDRYDNPFYVTLGAAPGTTPVNFQLGFGGWGLTHSFDVNCVAHWAGSTMNNIKDDRVTCYIKEQKANGNRLNGEEIQIKYAVDNSKGGTRIVYYLTIKDFTAFQGCTQTAMDQGKCGSGSDKTNTLFIGHNKIYGFATPTQGSGTTTINDKGIYGTDGNINPSLLRDAKMIDQGYEPTRQEYKRIFKNVDSTTQYVSLYSGTVKEVADLALSFSGWGATHSVQLSIVADGFSSPPNTQWAENWKPDDNMVTVYVKDNKGIGVDMTQAMSFVYTKDGSSYGGVRVWLKLDPSYLSCNGNTACLTADSNGARSVTIRTDSVVSVPSEDGTDTAPPLAYAAQATVVQMGLSSEQVITMKFSSAQPSGAENFAIGTSRMREPIKFSGSVSAYGNNFGFSGEILSDTYWGTWDPSSRKAMSSVSVTLKDNIVQGTTDTVQYINFFWMPTSGGYATYYISFGKDFSPVCTSDNMAQCSKTPPTILMEAKGGPSFIPGRSTDSMNAANVAPVQLTRIGLSSDNTFDMTFDSSVTTDAVYVPLFKTLAQDSVSMSVAVKGWGSSHGMLIDVTADPWGNGGSGWDTPFPTPAGKVTMYVKDNKGNTKDHTKALSLVYRGVDKYGMYVAWLKFDADYLACTDLTGDALAKCTQASVDGKRSVSIKYTVTGPSTITASNMDSPADNLDPQGISPKDSNYATATKIELGRNGPIRADYTLPTDKTITTYYPVGTSKANEAVSCEINFAGWGKTTSALVTIVSQWISKAIPPQPNKVSAYFTESGAPDDDQINAVTVIYARATSPDASNTAISYYLKVDTSLVICPDQATDPKGYSDCNNAAITLALTCSGGASFIAGTYPGGSQEVAPSKATEDQYFASAKMLHMSKMVSIDQIVPACLSVPTDAGRRRDNSDCPVFASASSSSSNAGMYAGIVIGVIIAAVAGAFLAMKIKSRRDTAAQERVTASFDNPLYETGEDTHSEDPGNDGLASASGGYMDVAPQGSSASTGYMDVTSEYDGGNGYMDVSPQNHGGNSYLDLNRDGDDV